MALSWNEIKQRAVQFSKEWEHDFNEDAEAKSFMDAFFNVFGIARRRVATFETHVKKADDKQGYIDLLWKGQILIEFKSRGKDLDKAHQQAIDYFPGLKNHDLPKYILVSDFARFRLYNLDEDITIEFPIKDLYKHVKEFGFIAGYEKRTYKEQDPVNIEAALLMGKLHDKLEAIGYKGHQLEVYLVRLLFCLFADDTSIFEKDIFREYIETKTNVDGSDLAAHISQLFEVLNTAKDERLKNMDEALAAFPYVNGKLFEEHLHAASFDSEMRKILLECCALNWGKISPAIFGSLFQSVMNPKERRNLGAHYTSEKNILKLIKPLFLDELWQEFEKAKDNKNQLNKLHEKISLLRFLDPACGCGNFLIIAYRELRMLELEIIKRLNKNEQAKAVSILLKIDVDRFYGIELDEFASQIAQVAMWLIDHQMNMIVSEEFGEYYVRLPLKKSPVIKNTNSLRFDWHTLIDPIPWEKKEQVFDYIFGNPPFIGSKLMTQEQRDNITELFKERDGSGVLDYVTGWYIKAAAYLQQHSNEKTKIKCGFVSTNSISQGEQVGILWNELLNLYNIKIHFAHRTFKWGNEAKGNAAVHVVIIGFSNFDINEKRIFEYADIKGEPHEVKVKSINPYLIEGADLLISSRSIPISNVPQISKGNQPTDGGNLLLDDNEKNELLRNYPEAKKYIKKLVGAQEYIHNINRWCLWLVDASPSEIRSIPTIVERLKRVQEMRLKSTDPKTRDLANTPWLFREMRNFNSFVIVPSTSSENRKYVPMGFGNKNIIPTNLVLIIPDATIFHFGILTSLMHMAWVKSICGRLESRFRYSKDIVYNNYPWPESPSEKQIKAVEEAAQKVLDARAQFQNSSPSGRPGGASLADLYDPLTMPPALVKAHQTLDKAVDLCYRPQPFTTEAKRMEFLFELYEKYTAGLFAVEKKIKKQKK